MINYAEKENANVKSPASAKKMEKSNNWKIPIARANRQLAPKLVSADLAKVSTGSLPSGLG